MSNSQYGVLIGMLLGIVWALSSFPAALLVALLGVIGWVVGKFVHVDLAVVGKKIEALLSR